MTDEELASARLGQLKELERENTRLRLLLAGQSRELGFTKGALAALARITGSIYSANSLDASLAAIKDLGMALDSVDSLLSYEDS